jgi:fatty-acyl-CoA synthase
MSEPTDTPDQRAETSGRPFPGVEVRIVDPETREELPVGERGEIAGRGWGMFEGYHNAPERNAEAIDADGWFYTGDMGRLDEDGRISFLGRTKDMLKVGGENVAALEVESFLQTHPAVRLAQVVGLPDERLTEIPAAFVQLEPGREVTEEELIAFCRGQIASFKIPRYVRLVDEWPMSATKIQKFKLRERLMAELGLD